MNRFDQLVCAVAQGLLAQEGRHEIGCYADADTFAGVAVAYAEALERKLVEREERRAKEGSGK